MNVDPKHVIIGQLYETIWLNSQQLQDGQDELAAEKDRGDALAKELEAAKTPEPPADKP